MEINMLKEKIEQQKEINLKLFYSIPIATKEDPLGEKAEPILKLWREGSKELKRLLKELQELELSQRKPTVNKEESKSFVNSFGEATERNITTNTYEKSQKRIQKEIMSFIS